MESCKRIIENRIIDGNIYIIRNTGTFVWDAEGNKDFSVEVIVQEIKEIRNVNNCQLKIFYGNSFILDSIILQFNSSAKKECLAMRLKIEMQALNNSTYKTNFQRIIRRKINSIKNVYDTYDESRINIQEAKNLFQEIDLKVTEQQILELSYSSTPNSEISVKEIMKFIEEEVFIMQEKILSYRLDDHPSLKGDYINAFNEIDFMSFRKFLSKKQDEDPHLLKKRRAFLLKHFLMDVENDFITPSEFLNYLFSEQNGIRDKSYPHDMSRPLSEYFIASSHNTYLTGNQFTSLSSVESYARVLRQGCRCVELDCWPLQDRIVITHGYTRTSKISFESVLRTIQNHAFETTPYPLILSIENHCPVDLQRDMAKLFVSIFGQNLLTSPIRENETVLPSPNDLRNCIILKFKKIAKEDSTSSSPKSDQDKEAEDYSEKENVDRMSRRGFLRVKISSSNEWETKLFSLFEKSLISCEIEGSDYESEENAKTFSHELWYHGIISSQRIQQMQSSEDNEQHKDGTFFVATVRDEFEECLCLFVWNDGELHQIPINYNWTETNEQIFGIHEESFYSLEELINNYKLYPLQENFVKMKNDVEEPDENFSNESYQLEIKLTSPVYQMNDHTKMEWFHPSLTKEECDKVMQTVNIKGSFLVRNCESSYGNLTLVFCSTKNTIRRVIIKRHEDFFTIDSFKAHFKSVVNLIEFLQFNETGICLSHPITRKEVKEIIHTNDLKSTESIYSLEEAELMGEPFKVHLGHGTEIWSFRLNLSSIEHILLGCKEYNQAKLWITSIEEVIQQSNQAMEESERRYKVAKEMSDITVYFQKGNFNEAFYAKDGKGVYNEVFSFEEDKMHSLIYYHPQKVVDFHKISITRIYPKGIRMNSSNYNPLPFWFHGCQLVALNYQTGDLGVQLNEAWFQQTNNCGYVLRPHCADDISSEPIQLEITILGARVMCENKWKFGPLFIDTEIHGVEHDHQCYTTELDGGFLCLSLKEEKPKKHEIIIKNPEYALLQFTLYAKYRKYTIGQYTIHVNDLKESGYRSVPLKNKHSEPLFLSSILVYIREWKKIELIDRMMKLSQNLKLPAREGIHHRKWAKELEKAERILKKLDEASKKEERNKLVK